MSQRAIFPLIPRIHPLLEAGISIRCYQKFGSEIISFFNRGARNFLWNLHPGILPRYRGVMTLFRAMFDGEGETSYSLHVVNENWDDGPLIDIRPQPLDASEAMLTNYCLLAPSGVPIIMDNLNKIAEGKSVGATPQRSDAKGYYTFPTREEMDAFLAKGLKLVDPGYVRAALLTYFSIEGTQHHRELSKLFDGICFQDTGASNVLALR